MLETNYQNGLQTDYGHTQKSLFLDHYFKSLCEMTLIWKKLAPVQSSYNYFETPGDFPRFLSFLIILVNFTATKIVMSKIYVNLNMFTCVLDIRVAREIQFK